jgi:hypothetical protein
MPAASYRVEAYNTAKYSENRIHDDSVARRFGFTGGLVPGVDVYAYMSHPPVARWGRAWLERGTLDCRFQKPVYDGAMTDIVAQPEGEGLRLSVRSGGADCAQGTATLPPTPTVPELADYPYPPAPPDEAARPPAGAASLAEGNLLGIRPVEVTPDFAAKYCADVRETLPLYRDEGLVHPGLILRLCNWALTHNVVLGPWIHVGSQVQNLSAARIGETLTVRARVVRNYDHKGHLFVDLDALALAGGARPLARILHTAIYRPRQVAAGWPFQAGGVVAK